MIGLTSDNMSDAYMSFLLHRISQYASDKAAVEAGEAPELAQVLSELRRKHGEISPEIFALLFSILDAFWDTIALNNLELAKSVSHVDK